MRQLQRDVGTELLRCDAVEDLLVALDHDPRLRFVAHPFAKERRVGEKPLLVETSQHDHRLVERLAGDEAGGTEAHPVTAHDALHSGALGCGEDRLPQHCRRSRERYAPVIGADSTTKQCLRLRRGVCFQSLERRRVAPIRSPPTGDPLRRDHGREYGDEQSRNDEGRAPSGQRARRARIAIAPASRFQLIEPAIRSLKSDVAEEVDRRSGDERDELGSRERGRAGARSRSRRRPRRR